MIRIVMAGAALALAAGSVPALAQANDRLDCAVTAVSADQKAAIGTAMAGGGEEAGRDDLFKQLGAIVDGCIERHGIAAEQKSDYFDYSLARISREWLIGDLANSGMSANVVDTALDFRAGGANPDLSQDMSEEQIMKIVQAYIEDGVDIEKVDQTIWEKVGAYAAATSIFWNKRKALPF